MTILICLFIIGWVAVSLIGTQAYFLGEQTKPIHQRNWRSDSFHTLAVSITGQEVEYASRASSYQQDAYLSRLMRRRVR